MSYANSDEKDLIQQDGKNLFIWEMDEAYLKNSIKKIENDIKIFKDDNSAKILEDAKKKLLELKAAI